MSIAKRTVWTTPHELERAVHDAMDRQIGRKSQK